MFQPGLFGPRVFTVQEITRYLRGLIESDPILQDVWVEGEISNLSRPASGHLYFTLKDNHSALKCVMWRSRASRISFDLTNGIQAEVHGKIDVYEQGGQYQLYVDTIQPGGQGDLYKEYLRLKEQLEAEGLFSDEYKRPVPAFPQTIGVVTSATGAAVQDIFNTIALRFPLVKVILAPASVQGDSSPAEIVRAIQYLNEKVEPDIILVGRGGGSLEDLWSFNDERVVRAIFESKTPIISGIGHETDFTLSDFAADLRAPTPTGAAVAATPDIREIKALLDDITTRMNSDVQYLIQSEQFNARQLTARLERASPIRRIQNEKQRVDERYDRSARAYRQAVRFRKNSLDSCLAHFRSLSPDTVLKRGYALILNQDSKMVKSIKDVSSGMLLRVQFSDGQAVTRTESTNDQSPFHAKE
jgi:exodeoxyribonuclease VII large subunit